MNTRTAVSLSVLAAALASGCGSGSDGAVRAGPNACLNFSAALAIKDRMDQAVNVFNSGEEIRFELAVTNRSNAPQKLFASSPCWPAVFEVADRLQQKVWGNADGIACAALVPTEPRTYAPLETVLYPVTWGQQRSDTAPPSPPVLVPPGQYSVTGTGGLIGVNDQGESIDCGTALRQSGAFTIR